MFPSSIGGLLHSPDTYIGAKCPECKKPFETERFVYESHAKNVRVVCCSLACFVKYLAFGRKRWT